jgi:hypothetical protein
MVDDPRNAQPPPFHLRPASFGLDLACGAVATESALLGRHEQPGLCAFPVDAARDQRAHEGSVFIDDAIRKRLLTGVFGPYYAEAAPETVIFDTYRGWTTKLPAFVEPFPDARGRSVEARERKPILPPDLFTRYQKDAFWEDLKLLPPSVKLV